MGNGFEPGSPGVDRGHEAWAGPESPLADFIRRQTKSTLASYGSQPNLVREHANQEHDTAHGGYADRQIIELVQNSADALLQAESGCRKISIRLAGDRLYCADDGLPVDRSGITALMFAHLSNKRDTAAIGRFGLGFKSVLGVTDAPEFYSRSVSFRFGRKHAKQAIEAVTGREFQDYPVLRLPEPLDPGRAEDDDDTLAELMSWATNIVRLPLLERRAEALKQQIKDFPAEFLLLAHHVRELHLEDGQSVRRFTLRQHAEKEFELLQADVSQGTEDTSRWRIFQTMHTLSQSARDDRRSLDDSNEVPITWAAPLDGGRSVGQFWAYFPTRTASLVGGILNAPWKTNEDRQNLLPGPYNDEIIRAAAKMVAGEIAALRTEDDPARHLDVLPRRPEAGDTDQTELLRRELFGHLSRRPIVPDQNGDVQEPDALRYPPSELTSGNRIDEAPFERWAAYENRPTNWLHHTALTRERLSRIDRLYPGKHWQPRAPRASLREWLEALVERSSDEQEVAASTAAIRAAEAIPKRQGKDLGNIVLTADNAWKPVEPDSVFLPPRTASVDGQEASTVHPQLAEDPVTRKALHALGLRTPSPESTFRRATRGLLGSQAEHAERQLTEFWNAARELPAKEALGILREFVPKRFVPHQEAWLRRQLRVRSRAESWCPLDTVLLPGGIVPTGDNRDPGAIIDLDFHGPDEELLRGLGATDRPVADYDLRFATGYDDHHGQCVTEYRKRSDLPHSPRRGYLQFGSWPRATGRRDFKPSTEGAGPLDVLAHLSPEAAARYTDDMLKLEATFRRWTMGHDGNNGRNYPSAKFWSLTVPALQKHGRIRISAGVVPFRDALGPNPRNAEAQQALWQHANVDRIQEAFDLHDPRPEFIGEAEPIPLTDVWPGLAAKLSADRTNCLLIRCRRIAVAGSPLECVDHGSNVYLADSVVDEEEQLRLVSTELGLFLNEVTLQQILSRRTPKEVQARRNEIREKSSDADRLLAAVGEQALRDQLPGMLLAMLELDGGVLSGKRLAEAAIATWHTDALRRHREALHDLDPPRQWAGSSRAVAFVQALGFTEDWAGKRARKHDPWLEVQGPPNLPPLHDYQERVTENLRALLRGESASGGERRAMISLPTGSGKTRVAVQAIVEAIREHDFPGGVLWVADRHELCEQAVEGWQQVWSSIGGAGKRLRISRTWGGQESPRPLTKRHVVVASIQTLQARIEHADYAFLADLQLVVFDEAHRSIAPTYTSVMEKIGLTRYQKPDEPFLVGLTATPYRGRNEEETTRLVNRYGQRRLDDGAFPDDEPTAVVQHLQKMRILSQVDHATILGDTFRLRDDDLQLMRQEGWKSGRWNLPWLPQFLEDRIARSVARTKRILDAFERHIEPGWPVLVFATSVEHAQTLAALLEDRNIPSRAISGGTRPATRHHVVDEFRNGRIQALVNYGVFREGFDAPKTRAILVARPVYSPNLYFQMIGRGLRGPKNGGTDRCLILNVEDNIENFGPKLAFSDLDWLWEPR